MKRFGANGRLVDDSLEDSVGKWLPTAKEKGEGDMAAHWVLGFLYIMTMFCSSVITVAKYCEMYSKLPNYMLQRGKFHAMSVFPNEKAKGVRKQELLGGGAGADLWDLLGAK